MGIMMNLRDGFRDIVSGWTLIDGIEDLTERIEQVAEWTKANGPLLPDEEATARLLIEAGAARLESELFGTGPPHHDD